MANVTLPYTFTAATTAVAAEVNADFTALVNSINNDLVHRDGSKAMTAQLTLTSTNPSSNQHAASKVYVDRLGLQRTFVHTLSAAAQNNATPAAIFDTGTIETPQYAYQMVIVAHIMQKASSDGANYYKVTFGGASTTSIVINANGSGDRHSGFTMGSKWMSAGTLVARTNQASSTAARWRFWNENGDVFGTTDFNVVAHTFIVPT